MAITTANCTSYKAELLQGIHSSSDTYMMALYNSSATLDATTTAYSTTNEITGTGYTAGGVALTGFAVTTSGTTAMLTFNNASWSSSTLSAVGALIYNATKANRAVATYSFGGTVTSTASTFTVTMPSVTTSTALVRVA